MASLTATRSLGIGETFSNLKKQGKVGTAPIVNFCDMRVLSC
jgi:tryptophan synthase alpha chain